MKNKINKVLITYILLIVFHVVHIFEEIAGKVTFIESFYKSLSIFLIVNAMLLLIPITLVYFTIKQKTWAYRISYGYAIVMIVDGIYHLINNVAGKYTGVGLLTFGVLLMYTLHIRQKP